MPLPPYPVAPAPITWTKEEVISTGRLYGDLENAALLLANRPLFVAAQTTTTTGLASGSVVPLPIDTEYIDSWNGHMIPATTYLPPMAGWYLWEGDVESQPIPITATIAAGVQVNGSTNYTGGKIPGNGNNDMAATFAQLLQLKTTDTVAMYGLAGSTSTSVATARIKGEMVALPTSLTGVTNGTLVTSPQAAALWPAGPGTQITNPGGITAGAVSIKVTDTTGMVVGGTLGLDWYLGQMTAPVAESVTITSISGTTIGISPTSFSHQQGAPVAVPISAAFLNQQARDLINFLAYPPVANLTTSGTSASLASQTFPAGTAISFTGADADNFTGWSSGSATRYTFPLSGVYYVYGQVYIAASNTYSMAAGLRISGGTTSWGSSMLNSGSTSTPMSATVRRGAMRVTAGQYVELIGSQNSGGSLALQGSGGAFCRLIAVWRGF